MVIPRPPRARIGLADERPVVLLDTSAAIALVLEDHEAHAAMVAPVRGRGLGLAGHAWFEAYSVLIRLPGDLRRSPRPHGSGGHALPRGPALSSWGLRPSPGC